MLIGIISLLSPSSCSCSPFHHSVSCPHSGQLALGMSVGESTYPPSVYPLLPPPPLPLPCAACSNAPVTLWERWSRQHAYVHCILHLLGLLLYRPNWLMNLCYSINNNNPWNDFRNIINVRHQSARAAFSLKAAGGYDGSRKQCCARQQYSLLGTWTFYGGKTS